MPYEIAPDELNALPSYMIIGGERVQAVRGESFATFDPATGAVLARVPASDAEDVSRAVKAARVALKGTWQRMHPSARGKILYKTAEFIRRDRNRLARTETLDCGKPLSESESDIESAAKYCEYYAGIADKIQGETIPIGFEHVSFTLLEPIGVTAHIVPWNFPLVTLTRSVAPALAAGNTAVVKPAEETPLTAVLLAELLLEAGLPAGVLNVVTGTGPEAGAPLAAHSDVDHITFTGSVETGSIVMAAAARHVASVTLELGGKSPMIVLSDADLDAAAKTVSRAIYKNSGQICSAGSRLIIDRRVHDSVVEKLIDYAERLRHGHGLQNPDLGPLVSEDQIARVERFIVSARQRNILVATGGNRVPVENCENGFFYAPTILDSVSTGDPVAQEEIFGPVLVVQVVDSIEEALATGNNSQFGLAAGIFTRDIGKALALARDLDSGQVFINDYGVGGAQTPFGGVKRSGFGRERGLAALRNYVRIKSVTARI